MAKRPLLIDPLRSVLLLIDFQQRLMPAIADSERVVGNAARLLAVARLLGVPVLVTEQNPHSLGVTVEQLAAQSEPLLVKSEFDATQNVNFGSIWPSNRDCAVIAGCEAHVCVLQTALGLLNLGRNVFVVEDGIGSRQPASKAAALNRLRSHGADIVTTEMVVFEWLETAAHPKFKDALALIK